MLNKKFCVPLENLVEDLTEQVSAADVAELTIQLQIGKSIREARTAKKITQSAFAKIMGVTQSMVSRWESGECNFTLHSLVSIGTALNIPVRNPLASVQSAQCTNIGIVFSNTSPIGRIDEEDMVEVAA